MKIMIEIEFVNFYRYFDSLLCKIVNLTCFSKFYNLSWIIGLSRYEFH